MPSSANRKWALMGALAAWAVSTSSFAALFDSPPSQWQVAALLDVAALGALGSSGVLVEMRRLLIPHAAWTGQAHFRWVILWAVVLFVLQIAGISIAAKTDAGVTF